MRFLLDENFPRAAISLLESSGHEALHALDIFPPGTSDETLFAEAQRRTAMMLSTDRDFIHTVPLLFAEHHGAIVITLARCNRAALPARLSAALEFVGESVLANRTLLVREVRIIERRTKGDAP